MLNEQMVRLVALALVACSAGCQGGTTSLLVNLSLAPGAHAPQRVQVSVFDRFSVLNQNVTTPAGVPGPLRLAGLPPKSQLLRVAFLDEAGLPRGWLAPVMTIADHEVTASATLGDSAPDADS